MGTYIISVYVYGNLFMVLFCFKYSKVIKVFKINLIKHLFKK